MTCAIKTIKKTRKGRWVKRKINGKKVTKGTSDSKPSSALTLGA